MIAHSIKPLELPEKDIKIAKKLVMQAQNYANKEEDYEFLRNSTIETKHLAQD